MPSFESLNNYFLPLLRVRSPFVSIQIKTRCMGNKTMMMVVNGVTIRSPFLSGICDNLVRIPQAVPRSGGGSVGFSPHRMREVKEDPNILPHMQIALKIVATIAIKVSIKK